jgi:membrane-associated protein
VNSLVDAIVGLPPWLVLVLVFALPAVEASAFVGLVVPGEVWSAGRFSDRVPV